MPLFTAQGCTNTVACPVSPLPTATANCNPETMTGGINDVYVIPCDQILSEANIMDLAWWQALVDGSGSGANASFLGNFGRGLGSIAKKNVKTERLASCEVESVISATWGLKYIIKEFDKSVDKVTHAQINTILTRASRYLAIARMCDGDNTVLPIGRFIVSDFDFNVPDNFEEKASLMVELGWFETGVPLFYTVTGLSTVVPKA